jgi:hypothetical protein
MSEKKMVRRSVAIGLGIICIVVVAGLAGAFAYYVNDKNNTISSLNTQIYQLYSNVTKLRDQVNDLNDTLKLEKIDPWTNGWTDMNQTAGSYSSWNFSVPYAGAIWVAVLPPAKNSTYIRVIWYSSLLDFKYDYQTYGQEENGRQHAAFPVLPTSNVEIRVGNTVPAGEVRVTVLLEYLY